MASVLKKRSVAAIITAAVILISTLAGVHFSVGRQSRAVERQFYEGVYLESEGYTQTSIDSQLRQRANAATGLYSLAIGYLEESETTPLRDAYVALLDEETISAKYAADQALQAAAENVYSLLQTAGMSQRDTDGVEGYIYTLNAARDVIARSDYNRVVSDYMSGTLGRFPVNLLRRIALCDYPEYFGTEG